MFRSLLNENMTINNSCLLIGESHTQNSNGLCALENVAEVFSNSKTPILIFSESLSSLPNSSPYNSEQIKNSFLSAYESKAIEKLIEVGCLVFGLENIHSNPFLLFNPEKTTGSNKTAKLALMEKVSALNLEEFNHNVTIEKFLKDPEIAYADFFNLVSNIYATSKHRISHANEQFTAEITETLDKYKVSFSIAIVGAAHVSEMLDNESHNVVEAGMLQRLSKSVLTKACYVGPDNHREIYTPLPIPGYSFKSIKPYICTYSSPLRQHSLHKNELPKEETKLFKRNPGCNLS